MAFAVPTSSIAWSCECDLVTDPIALLAICALLEARLWQLIEDPRRPVVKSTNEWLNPFKDLITCQQSRSYESQCQTLADGRNISQIPEIYQEVWIAKQQGFSCFLSFGKNSSGRKQAQQWLKLHSCGLDSRASLLRPFLRCERELELEDKLCPP